MRAVTRALAVAGVGASLLVAGCGRPGTSAAGGSGPSSVPTNHAVTRCVTPKLTSSGYPGPAKTFTITGQDSGKTFCVTAGTSFYVFLHGTSTHLWGPIQPDSSVLARRASGVMELAIGFTGGFFQASRLGTATLTSVRTPCVAKPEAAVASSGRHCSAATLFKVTIVVRGKM